METEKIQDIYELTPLQQGILFHNLYTPEEAVYFIQLSYSLQGKLNTKAFEKAWQKVVDRHTILRTAFHWKDLAKPLQVVQKSVAIKLQIYDWSKNQRQEQKVELQNFLDRDRAKRFDFSQAPLMRLSLIRCADDFYYFIWSKHHLILDGWSTALILKEVVEIYQAIEKGKELSLVPETCYGDYIKWLQQRDLSQAEIFWREKLSGFKAPTSLSYLQFDRLSNRGKKHDKYDNQSTKLSKTITEKLQTLARSYKLTLNTIVQGLWAILLSRYSNSEDVVFGVTVAGRPTDLPRAESMVGVFINTLPIRVKLDTETLLLPWFIELQNQQVEVRQYQYSSLVDIQRWSEIPKGLPLFESIFVFENYPVDKVLQEWQGDLNIQSVSAFDNTNYPLTVTVIPSSELEVKIAYDCDRFSPASISRILGHLKTLLEGIIAHPEGKLSKLCLLTPAERQQLLVEWNDTEVEYPQEQCIHELFEKQVEKTPDAVAVVFEEQQLTYRQLNNRANQLANYLQQEHGVQPEVLVGICVERSVEMIVGILGILKAGGAYLPLDPNYPQERLDFILADAQVSILLSQAKLSKEFLKHEAKVVCLDSDWELIDNESKKNSTAQVFLSSTSYILYTSGSTGKPKAVVVEHRNTVAFIHWVKQVFTHEQLAAVLASTSICFDLSVFELFSTLSCGGKVILAENALALPNLLAANEVTLINTVPSTIAELLRLDGLPDSIGTVNLAGESLNKSLVQRIYQHQTIERVFNLYGPSEDTTYSTFALLQKEDDIVTIGRPIANTEIYLLDQSLQPVPRGVAGEIYIGGAGIARGYFERPELTAERFIPHAFSEKPGGRLYRTGDLARYLEDGEIEYIGRIDYQVKLRGFRIELGEIEAVLNQHPAVATSVVILREDVPGDQSLVAYATFNPEQTETMDSLRQAVKSELPGYMVPSAWVILDALPLTPNGKINRQALPIPDLNQLIDAEQYLAPITPTQEILAGIWQEILGVERVGINDNFFELGGHSLIATRVLSQIKQVFSIELPLRSVFEQATVAQLAPLIETASQDQIGIEYTEIKLISREEAIPLSFAQQRLWFLSKLEPENPFYNQPTALKLNGELNIAVLKQSLTELIRRHEPLRTTFSSNPAGKTLQIINPPREVVLPVINLQQLNPTSQQQEIEQLASLEAQKVFNLEQDRPLRVTLLKLNPDQHIILFTTHHIITDEWSISILVREVSTLYQAFLEEKASPLAELTIQYADYARWQREWLTGDVLDRQLNYWQQQLESVPRLELPTDYPRPVNTTYQGATVSFELSSSLTAAIKVLAQQEGVTLFMMLLAAFKVLLSRYSHQEDIAIGTPIANRNRGEIENLIGFFVNTLVIRSNLEDNPSFRELLQRVKEITLGAYTHQDVPFEQLVEELKVDRNLNRNPLFDVMFIIEQREKKELKLPGLSLSYLEAETNKVVFDLIVSITETKTGLAGAIRYSTELFKPSTIESMAAHFQVLLEGIIAHPQVKVSQLPILTAAEKQQLLVEWNDTQVEYPQEKCIHELFEEQVEKTPDAVAVVFEEQQLTYRELNNKANQLANYLQQEHNVQAEVLVGICVERSVEMVVGLLGILKAGGAYLPLDPNYPSERLQYMLSNARVTLIITIEEKCLSSLPKHQTRTICLDTDWVVISKESQENLLSQNEPSNLAYVIYTSGSTGKPKGVLINHYNVVRLFAATQEKYNFKQNDVWTLFHSYAFDFSVWEIWGALLYGARLAIVSYWTSRSPEAFYELLKTEKVTVLNQTPSVFKQLIQVEKNLNSSEDLSLRLVIFGGEALELPSLKPWFARHGDSYPKLVNMYGITETTVHATYRPLTIADLECSASVIGRSIPDLNVYVLDSHLQPVPVGVAGEVYIGGAGIARGYLNLPELTATRFIPHPFSKEADCRLYRTGDKARYLPNGEIEYIGRIDYQVKLRGFRIELGEIEAALNQHPAVANSVVILREDVPENQQLVAYLLPKSEQELEIAQLRSCLAEKLPGYMIPSAFVELEALPLTQNGKIDRKALPVADSSQLVVDTEYLAPGTPTQEIVANIWQEILGIEKVGVQDNFFELGGHSLIATRVVSKIRTTFNIELALRSLFEKPTIRELAPVIETATKNNIGLAYSEISLISRKEAIPLSFAQQRLWFLAQLEPENPFYNQPTALKLHGELNIAVLKQSLEELIRRHEPLRTTFSSNLEGKTKQIIHPPREVVLPTVNLEQLNPSQQEQQIKQLASLEAQKVFNLEQDQPLRVTLLKLNPDQHIILFTTHHIITDEWSIGILVREISTLYQAFLEEKTSPLPELAIQYADFALWQREWLTGEVVATQLNYWQQQLENVPRLDLPTDYPRPVNTTYQGASHTFDLPSSLSTGIKALAQSQGTTLFMTLLAAFKLLLSRYSGQEDIPIGTPIANRNRAEIEGLIGFFVNTLVLRTNLEGNPSFTELLQRVKELTLGAYTHQDIPFEQLVEELKVERNLNRNPLFDVMFTTEQVKGEELKLPGLSLSYLDAETNTTLFDLTLSMSETPKGLSGTIEYRSELFKGSTIERMVAHFQVLLEEIIAHPEVKVSQLPILTVAERQQLLVEWNNTKVEYPQEQCIHELFEEQVEKTPDAVALVYEDQYLTYRELNNRANQLAHYLQQEHGVQAEVLVGICVKRSVEMVVGLLGILKAGGAYLPLDPSYPTERLDFMLADAQVSILLSQAKLSKELLKHEPKVVCLDSDWELINRESKKNSTAQVVLSNMSYILYTSGSTGKPKAVVVEHRNTVAFIHWVKQVFTHEQLAAVLASTSICFDLSVFELFFTLSCGGKVILVENALALPNLLAANEVTLINTVPSAITELLRLDGLPDSIGTVNLAGEPLHQSLVQRIYQHQTIERVFNLYGPSEDTTYSTFALLQNEDDIVTIGRPINNTEIYILNTHLQPVPVGVSGEIYIGGEGIARGYLNQAELTALKFIPNPFSNKAASRLYKTGDRARYLENGEIEYIGRIDYQVKLRGFRIELGEIESALNQHPVIANSVVIIREDTPENKQLVAYIVFEQDRTVTNTELRRFLQERLPLYSIPTSFVTIESMPLSSNGKIDRRSLPLPDNLRPELEVDYVMPETEAEQTIADVWKKVLDLEKIGIHDNFFEIGGHSLLLMQVNSKLRQLFDANLSIVDMFRYPTISSLSEYLNNINPSQPPSVNEDWQNEKLKAGKAKQKRRREKIRSI
jgi:amino acid adenylation domain-containing protein